MQDADIFFEYIKNRKNIAIVTHIRPDGDAYGSSLSLYQYFKEINKNSDILIDAQNNVSHFDFLINYNMINKQTIKDYDGLICIDCADESRMGKYDNILNTIPDNLCIDHHITNRGFCKNNIILNFSSTSEIIYRILKTRNEFLSKDILICLFTGISTDTGNFMHSNTNSDVFYVAYEMTKNGVEVENIVNKVYKQNSLEYYKLLSLALNSIKLYIDGRIGMITLTKKDFDKAGMSNTEGICSYALNMQGVVIGVLISEIEEKKYKIALRSKGNYDVSLIANKFGGGGHKNASGCNFEGSLQDCKKQIIKVIKEYTT